MRALSEAGMRGRRSASLPVRSNSAIGSGSPDRLTVWTCGPRERARMRRQAMEKRGWLLRSSLALRLKSRAITTPAIHGNRRGRPGSDLDQTLAHRVEHGLGAVVDVQLLVGVTDVVADGLLADLEMKGDLLVGHSGGHEF